MHTFYTLKTNFDEKKFSLKVEKILIELGGKSIEKENNKLSCKISKGFESYQMQVVLYKDNINITINSYYSFLKFAYDGGESSKILQNFIEKCQQEE